MLWCPWRRINRNRTKAVWESVAESIATLGSKSSQDELVFTTVWRKMKKNEFWNYGLFTLREPQGKKWAASICRAKKIYNFIRPTLRHPVRFFRCRSVVRFQNENKMQKWLEAALCTNFSYGAGTVP